MLNILESWVFPLEFFNDFQLVKSSVSALGLSGPKDVLFFLERLTKIFENMLQNIRNIMKGLSVSKSVITYELNVSSIGFVEALSNFLLDWCDNFISFTTNNEYWTVFEVL